MTRRREKIAAITGLSDPADVGAIEAIMGIECNLSSLTPRAFEIEARIALKVFHAMDPSTRDWYRGEGRMVS